MFQDVNPRGTAFPFSPFFFPAFRPGTSARPEKRIVQQANRSGFFFFSFFLFPPLFSFACVLALSCGRRRQMLDPRPFLFHPFFVFCSFLFLGNVPRRDAKQRRSGLVSAPLGRPAPNGVLDHDSPFFPFPLLLAYSLVSLRFAAT